MKEITRIHIAKVAYDIEINAKKSLEQYVKTLELYANDPSIMEDIEIRITELLGERGVAQGGVIAVADIEAIRSQLGEPKDFADTDSPSLPADKTQRKEQSRRRLYRDSEQAVAGGVLSGLGKYLDVNVAWIRLIFLVLTVISLGSAIVAYMAMWLAVPMAKTAAEKLELEGKPVTLESIRARGAEIEQQPVNHTPKTIHRIMLTLVGLGGIVLSIGALIITAVVVFGVSVSPDNPLATTTTHGLEWINTLTLTLFVLSGLLLSGLGVLLAYGAFSRRFSKRIGIVSFVIVLAGILSFSGGLATAFAGAQYESNYLQQAMKEESVDLEEGFGDITRLVASAHTVSRESAGYSEMLIEYVVDPGTPRYLLRSLPGVKVDVKLKDGEARVTLKSSPQQNRAYQRAAQPRLVIYGPALDHAVVEQGYFQYSAAHATQQRITIDTLGSTSSTLYGSYGEVIANGSGQIWAQNATIYSLRATLTNDGTMRAGVVRNLDISQPDACPAHEGWQENRLVVQGVSSGVLTYNGTEQSAKTLLNECGSVVVGDEEGTQN